MMRRNLMRKMMAAALIAVLLLAALGGYAKKADPAEDIATPGEDAAAAHPGDMTEEKSGPENKPEDKTPDDSQAESDPRSETGRQDGERYEGTVVIEGMTETVKYEHVRSDALGFEMGYDYESFTHRSELGRECFISVRDDPEMPENWLTVEYSPVDSETAAAAIAGNLSYEYEVTRESFELENAGACIRIGASAGKDGKGTLDLLQTVYIIPAADGSCRIATARYSYESADGFGVRFRAMMHTFTVIDRQAENAGVQRQDGERYEAVVILEGMEETVRYEHLIQAALGFEMDYDYETLTRKTEADKETFVLVYDDPEKPENYFEITRRSGDAGTVAAAVSAELSREYGIMQENLILDRSGACIQIEASTTKDGRNMVEPIQRVYVIPAGDGCVVVWLHCSMEAAEGFGRRVHYMLDTLAILPRA